MNRPGRRQFLLGAGVLGLGALGGLPRGGSAVARALVAEAPLVTLPETLHVLSVQEYFTLAAACERVFPRDDTPGALDLGAPEYVDRALTVRPAPGWSSGLRPGLARLDSEALRRFSVTFAKATPAQQDELLRSWEASVEQEDAAFVRDLVTATLEGALSDPVYGGNRAGEAWRSLGYRVDPFTPTRTT